MNKPRNPYNKLYNTTVKHKFAYLADGRKLHSISDPANDGGLAYIGSSVFIINEGKYDGFESTSFSAGRIVRNGNGTYTVQYHITDHLGSVRAVLNQSMTVLEQNDYYPFGLRHPNSSLKTTANRYRYNGKEEIAADATSDYGARQYSAEFCQWLQVDPLAEKYYSWSPYNFCVGNPLRNIDPNGMGWITATYNGVSFYYYDERINSDEDIKTMYYYGDGNDNRDYYDISYLGSEGGVSWGDDEYTLNSDGTFSVNGNLSDSEIDMDDLHIGSSLLMNKEFKNKTSQNSSYGNYAGDKNPKLANGNDSYAIPPIDDLDYAGFVHDKAYDRVNAAGASDAFLNVRTIDADYELGFRAYKAYGNNATKYKNWGCLKIMVFSYTITGLKEMRR